MAQLLPQLKASFEDANGNPLVGGKVYTYIAGTQTPKITYTDFNQSATNDNPVILNARGEADIWLIDNEPYKIVLKDANNVDIYTVDNVTGGGGGGGSVSLGTVLVSAIDPVSGYLGDKLVSGDNITLTTVTDISGDYIRLDVQLDGKVLASGTDVTPGYLVSKFTSDDGSIIITNNGSTLSLTVDPALLPDTYSRAEVLALLAGYLPLTGGTVSGAVTVNNTLTANTVNALALQINYTPVLDGNNKINSVFIPALAITDTFVVASEAAMLALNTAEKGDVAVRTDLNKSFILRDSDPAVLGDWQELLTPTDSVLSVDGLTGAVNLETKYLQIADFNWAGIAGKPSPTITLAGHLTGNVTLTELANGILTATVLDDSHNHIIANVDGLQTALDGKLSNALTSARIFVGNASNIATGVALSGDATISNAGALTIANNVISNAKLRDSVGLSVIGRSANTTGDPADIVAATDGHVLRRSGTSLGFGTIPISSVTNLQTTLDSKANTSTLSSYLLLDASNGPITGPLTVSSTITATGDVRSRGYRATGEFDASGLNGNGVEISYNNTAGWGRVLSFDRTSGSATYRPLRLEGSDFTFTTGGDGNIEATLNNTAFNVFVNTNINGPLTADSLTIDNGNISVTNGFIDVSSYVKADSYKLKGYAYNTLASFSFASAPAFVGNATARDIVILSSVGASASQQNIYLMQNLGVAVERSLWVQTDINASSANITGSLTADSLLIDNGDIVIDRSSGASPLIWFRQTGVNKAFIDWRNSTQTMRVHSTDDVELWANSLQTLTARAEGDIAINRALTSASAGNNSLFRNSARSNKLDYKGVAGTITEIEDPSILNVTGPITADSLTVDNGTITLSSTQTSASAPNNSMFVDSTDSVLKWKDNSGSVKNLYGNYLDLDTTSTQIIDSAIRIGSGTGTLISDNSISSVNSISYGTLTVSTTTTISTSSLRDIIRIATDANITVTLPPVGENLGRVIKIYGWGTTATTNNVTIEGDGTEKFYYGNAGVAASSAGILNIKICTSRKEAVVILGTSDGWIVLSSLADPYGDIDA